MFSTGARLFPNQPILPSSLCAGVGSRLCTCVPKPHAQTAPFYFQTFISLLLRISLNLRSSCLTLRSSWDVGYTSTSALSVFHLVGLIWASRTEGKIKGWLYLDAGVQHSGGHMQRKAQVSSQQRVPITAHTTCCDLTQPSFKNSSRHRLWL